MATITPPTLKAAVRSFKGLKGEHRAEADDGSLPPPTGIGSPAKADESEDGPSPSFSIWNRVPGTRFLEQSNPSKPTQGLSIEVKYAMDGCRNGFRPAMTVSSGVGFRGPPRDQLQRRIDSLENKAQETSALFVATLTSFMGPFIISSVNVALPSIQKEFNANAVQLSWIATSLLLATAVMLVPVGRIADIHGRKRTFAWGLGLFTLATVLAGFSVSINMLIFFRVLQGMAAAMFTTTGMAMLTSIFPPQKRGRVIGIYVSAVYIGLSMGPFAGGILTQHIGWRSLFFLMVPFGVASLYITLRYLQGEWADARGEKLDVAGSLLYGISILALVYGASILPSLKAIYLLVFGLVCLGVFIWLELRVEFPVFDVKLFSDNKLFAFSSLAALINYSATFAVAFLMSLYLQYIKGMTPQAAGMVLIAQPLMMAVFSPLAGRWSDRIEPRKIASFGMSITALGLFLFLFIDGRTTIPYIIGTLILLGFGFAMFSSPNMSAIMGAVEKRFFGIASGTAATMRLLGQMTSMAVAMVIFSIFIGREEITPANYDVFLKGVKVCFTISAVLCLFGIFFSFFRGKLRG